MTDQPNTPAVLAVDWGGTWCRAGLIDRQGEVLWQARRPNPRGGGTAQYLALADTLLAEAFGLEGIHADSIGIAVAGPVDPESGTLYQPPNLMPLDGISLKQIWHERYGLPVALGNDANMAAIGEFHFGAGRDAAQAGRPHRSLFYVTVSTGIGGGVVERGSLLLGANGLTAEVGHTTIDTTTSAPPCQCGKRGCLEAVSSGTAIAAYARARLSEGRNRDSALAALSPEDLSARAVVAAAVQGDTFAHAVIARAVEGLAIGLANVVHLFNPDLIILGGGVSEGLTQLNLLPRIRQGIHERLMSELHKVFDLVPSVLGDNSGLLGAAAAAWELTDNL
ncbi:Glucokinase [Geodia barretti]|uniref:Glucokinase n=1 Tax=Geodia barretti TaxID=519541 RepID=A0AA35QY28_GEOBA|nr:Glucokinase [Geodia barretti]